MDAPDRYRPVAQPEEFSGVVRVEGIDPVNGLPVLIYDFEGDPLLAVGELESDHVPRILWSGHAAGRGRIVAAIPSDRRPVDASADGPLLPEQLLDVVRALRDAARAGRQQSGVVHGDLRPDRLILSGGRLLVEGFGVPWAARPGPFQPPESSAGSPEGDVWSLAAVIRRLGWSLRDETIAAVIEQCLDPDPAARPTAEELCLALEALVARALEKAPDEPTETTGRSDSTEQWRSDASQAAGVAGPAEGRNEQSRTTIEPAEPAGTAAAGVHETTVAEPAASGAGSSSDREPPDERRRRLTLLGLLMTAVVVLALLAVFGPRGGGVPAVGSLETTVYVVEVVVTPEDLPPVTIHLVSSPPGSALARGVVLGTAPRHLALDRAGTWSFRGSLADRFSEVVEIEVPKDRSLTLTIPGRPGR
jgi:hypothetical protein